MNSIATTTCVYNGFEDLDSSTGKDFEVTGWLCTTEYPQVELSVSSSSLPAVYNGFTYGEVIISVFAFLIFATVLYWSWYNWLRGARVRINQ